MVTRLAAILGLLLLTLRVGAAEPMSPAPSAFSGVTGLDAAVDACPADVSVFLHVNDAAFMRRQISDRPINRAITSFFSDGAFGDQWSTLARQMGLSETQLFDHVLGRQCTLMQRAVADGRGGMRVEWAMVTELPRSEQDQLLRKLRAVVMPPLDGFAMRSIPEHAMLVAARNDTMILGSESNDALFRELVGRWGGRASDAPSLATHEARRHFDKLGRGQAALFTVHGPSVGGWSAAVFSLANGSLRLRHMATFEKPPFSRPVTGLDCDIAVVREFEKLALMSMIEPTDVGPSLVEAFAGQSLGIELSNTRMLSNSGRRRLTIVGEEEGRLREPAEDILAPTVAICIEASNLEHARTAIDEHMVALANQFNQMGRGNFEIKIPPLHDITVGRTRRHVDLEPMTRAVVPDLPILNEISLNWSVVRGDFGSWYVIASHPDHLVDVVEVLSTRHREHGPLAGRFDSAGSLNGLRVARHLRSWIEQAPTLAAPGQEDEFRASLDLLAGFAEGMGVLRWQMTRPTRSTMVLDVEVDLAEGSPSVGR